MVRFIRHLIALHGNVTAWPLAPRSRGSRLTLGLLAAFGAAAGGCSGAADGGEVAAELSEHGDFPFGAPEVASNRLTASADPSEQPFEGLSICSRGVLRRKELRELSSAERRAFDDALGQVMRDTSPPSYDDLVKIHADNASFVHGQPMYLPFHRAYLRLLEHRLQRVDPSVTLPYWDFARDSQVPRHSSDLRSLGFGGAGDRPTGCVGNNPFDRWTPGPWTVQFPEPHCLQRGFEAGYNIYGFPSPEIVTQIIEASPGYEDLWKDLEWLAWIPKRAMGGDMKDRFYAPNDPLYWVSMAFIDKIWADWQRTNYQRSYSYGSDGTPASLNDQVLPFPVNVRDVMSTRHLCYTY